MKKKNIRNPELIGFRLIPETAGAILGGIWIKEDGSELKLKKSECILLTIVFILILLSGM